MQKQLVLQFRIPETHKGSRLFVKHIFSIFTMKLSAIITKFSVVVLCSLLLSTTTATESNLRGSDASRELQSNGGRLVCAYLTKADGTRIPIVTPCTTNDGTVLGGPQEANVPTGGSSSSSDSRD